MNKKVLLVSLLILIIDQFSKILVNSYLVNNIIILIPNFFKLEYAQNTGAAWSILNNQQFVLIIISIILLIILFVFYEKFKKNLRNIIAFGLLYGGIFGNLIDRLFRGYVIDFLSFKIFNYNYPIFNIADIAVVFGIILLVVAIIKGEDNENSSRTRSNKTR